LESTFIVGQVLTTASLQWGGVNALGDPWAQAINAEIARDYHLKFTYEEQGIGCQIIMFETLPYCPQHHFIHDLILKFFKWPLSLFLSLSLFCSVSQNMLRSSSCHISGRLCLIRLALPGMHTSEFNYFLSLCIR
jgi:hypothetical protein